jgi:thioredoxin-like negative regulator of GroEL
MVQRAAAEHRPLLIKVSTSWCTACRELERQLSSPTVAAQLQIYLKASYDAEEGEGLDVAERYNVITFPTLLFVGGDGREIHRLTGLMNDQELLARLARIRDGSETMVLLEQRAMKAPDDLGLQLQTGTAWALRGSREKTTFYLQRVLTRDKQNSLDLASQALLALGKLLLLRSLKDYQTAATTLQDLIDRYPSSPAAQEAVFPLAQSLIGQSQWPAALHLLTSWAHDAEQHDAVAWLCWRAGRNEVGLSHARWAVAHEPGNAAFWATLARLQHGAGQLKEAHAAWSRALKLDPENTHYRQQYELGAAPTTHGPNNPSAGRRTRLPISGEDHASTDHPQ